MSLVYPAHFSESVTESNHELLLHFEKFDQMGMRDDAETIHLHQIIWASELGAEDGVSSGHVEHVFQPSSGE